MSTRKVEVLPSLSSAIAEPISLEMTVLVGGLRVLGANVGGSKHGIFRLGMWGFAGEICA